MMKIYDGRLALLAMVFLLMLPSVAAADDSDEWGYHDTIGPAHWADLSAEYALCTGGKNQSPIDLNGFINSQLEKVTFLSQTVNTTIHNTGHTIRLDVEPGNSLSVGKQVYELKQIHFHTPSEHTLEGRSFLMEAHLVHTDSDGNILVTAVFLAEGRTNRVVKEIWRRIPTHKGESLSLRRIQVYDILPLSREYYQYNGSLTTPPCTEGVRWFVMKEFSEISRRQADSLMRIMEQTNSRPVQPVNARPLLR